MRALGDGGARGEAPSWRQIAPRRQTKRPFVRAKCCLGNNSASRATNSLKIVVAQLQADCTFGWRALIWKRAFQLSCSFGRARVHAKPAARRHEPRTITKSVNTKTPAQFSRANARRGQKAPPQTRPSMTTTAPAGDTFAKPDGTDAGGDGRERARGRKQAAHIIGTRAFASGANRIARSLGQDRASEREKFAANLRNEKSRANLPAQILILASAPCKRAQLQLGDDGLQRAHVTSLALSRRAR